MSFTKKNKDNLPLKRNPSWDSRLTGIIPEGVPIAQELLHH